jgi:aspartate aminotransferase-like enzyme
MPRFYWDFRAARQYAEKGQTPWTPAIAVLYGLRVGVARLRAEGRERTWARHAAVAAGAQAGLQAAGLQLVAAEGHRSHTVTAAWLPDGTDWAAMNGYMRQRGLVVAGGQGSLAGRILRVGHMGDVGAPEIAAAVRGIADALGAFGPPRDADAAAAAVLATHEAALSSVS